jgi:hypothetical protein
MATVACRVCVRVTRHRTVESTVGRTFRVVLCRRAMEMVGSGGGAVVGLEDGLGAGGAGVVIGDPAIEA